MAVAFVPEQICSRCRTYLIRCLDIFLRNCIENREKSHLPFYYCSQYTCILGRDHQPKGGIPVEREAVFCAFYSGEETVCDCLSLRMRARACVRLLTPSLL